MRLIRSVPIAALLVASATVFMPRSAHAQEVSPTGKGITGGALLGAEAVTLTEAAIGVKPAWPYIVGGIVGAGGGGVGGYFAEKSDTKLSLYLLAGGMALVIPTTVAILSATAYSPPANYTEDKGPSGEPVAEPPQPTNGAAPSTAPATTPPTSRVHRARQRRVALLPRRERPLTLYRPVLPPALIGLEPRGLTLSVPAVEVRDTFSQSERLRYGMKEQTELHVPVFNYVF
jgi:hypothetical protein